jgi:hypothetical protein
MRPEVLILSSKQTRLATQVLGSKAFADLPVNPKELMACTFCFLSMQCGAIHMKTDVLVGDKWKDVTCT